MHDSFDHLNHGYGGFRVAEVRRAILAQSESQFFSSRYESSHRESGFDQNVRCDVLRRRVGYRAFRQIPKSLLVGSMLPRCNCWCEAFPTPVRLAQTDGTANMEIFFLTSCGKRQLNPFNTWPVYFIQKRTGSIINKRQRKAGRLLSIEDKKTSKNT